MRNVLERLIPHTGVADDWHWEVRVFDDSIANAFVIPGSVKMILLGGKLRAIVTRSSYLR